MNPTFVPDPFPDQAGKLPADEVPHSLYRVPAKVQKAVTSADSIFPTAARCLSETQKQTLTIERVLLGPRCVLKTTRLWKNNLVNVPTDVSAFSAAGLLLGVGERERGGSLHPLPDGALAAPRLPRDAQLHGCEAQVTERKPATGVHGQGGDTTETSEGGERQGRQR